jgi:hypothetical protein
MEIEPSQPNQSAYHDTKRCHPPSSSQPNSRSPRGRPEIVRYRAGLAFLNDGNLLGTFDRNRCGSCGTKTVACLRSQEINMSPVIVPDLKWMSPALVLVADLDPYCRQRYRVCRHTGAARGSPTF